jgi:hypothetical protein
MTHTIQNKRPHTAPAFAETKGLRPRRLEPIKMVDG